MEHGFRLPSALDNRPLTYDEFDEHVQQVDLRFGDAGDVRDGRSTQVVEMIIRPTGLVDPEVEVRPTRNQVDDLMEEIRERAARKERVLVTTLTKKMAEDLTDYLIENGLRVRYLHSEIDTLERVAILRDLRAGVFDVLVGINLLREGLDLPEVSLVGILDADKEGYLRSGTSLIQTIGRASRNVEGKVIMYADVVTESMARAIGETRRRREMQVAFNLEHGIEPKIGAQGDPRHPQHGRRDRGERGEAQAASSCRATWRRKMARDLERKMREAAASLEFEKAAALRDELIELRRQIGGNESAALRRESAQDFRQGPGRTRRIVERFMGALAAPVSVLTRTVTSVPDLVAELAIVAGSWSSASSVLHAVLQRRLRSEMLRRHNDVAGYLFSAVGVLYAVVLGFVVVVVWQKYDNAVSNVENEVDAVGNLYHVVDAFPEGAAHANPHRPSQLRADGRHRRVAGDGTRPSRPGDRRAAVEDAPIRSTRSARPTSNGVCRPTGCDWQRAAALRRAAGAA